MKFCYAGPTWDKPPDQSRPEPGMRGAHSCNAIGAELCPTLTQLGLPCEQWNFGHVTNAGEPTDEAYDGVVLYDQSMVAMWRRLVPNWNRKSIVWMHAVDDKPGGMIEETCRFATDNDVFVCFLGASVAQRFEQKYGAVLRGRSNVWHWGCSGDWKWPPMLPDPYPSHPVALSVGRLESKRVVQFMNGLVPLIPGVELHVLSLTPKEKPELVPTPPGHYHGCFKHGTFNNYLYYADVGLDFALGTDQYLVNTKVFDLLAAGTPVVHEHVTGDWVIRQAGMGIPVPFGSPMMYADAIRTALNTRWQRGWCREWMRQNHSWTHRARELYDIIAPWLRK